MAQAAPSISGAFNPPEFRVADGLAGRLLFDANRLGSQFYPTVGERAIEQLLLRSVAAGMTGYRALSNDERAGLTSFTAAINTGKKIGFDAYLDSDNTGRNLAGKLPLSRFATSAFAPNIVEVNEAESDEDLYDPFFTFLVADRLKALFTVERLVEKKQPIITLVDAEPTSRPLPQFEIKREQGDHGPLILLATPAQRKLLHDIVMGPKARFGKVATRQLPIQPHGSSVRKLMNLGLGGKG